MEGIYVNLILLITIPSIIACKLNNTNAELSWREKLAKDLESDDMWNSPCPNRQIDVNIHFTFNDIQFDSQNGELTIKSAVTFYYKDHRLKWDPKVYNNLSTIVLDSRKFWTPFSSAFNLGEISSEVVAFTPLKVLFTGEVFFIVMYIDKVDCISQLENWPYDIQRCEVEFGAMFQFRKEFKFKLDRALDSTTESGAWYLKDYEQHEIHSNNTSAELKLIFILGRRAETLVAMIVYPVYVLAVLTLVSMMLDIAGQIRFGISGFSFLTHLIFLRNAALLIPSHSYDSPRLLIFHRGSIILTVLSILIPLCLREICRNKSSITLVDNLINSIHSSRVKFVFLWWNDGKEEKNVQLANVLNIVTFYIFILVYLCMLLVLIPKLDNEVINREYLLRSVS